MSRIAPEYVAARRVLLDALTALHGHAENLILVGAQAVYHHTGDADLNVPIMTSDADLAIDVTDLAEVPEIGDALRKAGFAPGDNPGHWVALSQVAVDLMVVPHQSGRTRNSARAARLAPHDKHTARIARGLEPRARRQRTRRARLARLLRQSLGRSARLGTSCVTHREGHQDQRTTWTGRPAPGPSQAEGRTRRLPAVPGNRHH